jgi:aspartate racemase
MNRPILGIIGGVGPLATACFMEALIRKTPARRDQDHMPMIVFNDPQIPDRTAHILDHSQPDPQPEMANVARWLENAGADYIAIACNTAHYYYQGIDDAVDIPVVNIMEETAQAIAREVGLGSVIGLLATEGTVASGVFQDYLEAKGLRVMEPASDDQAVVSSLIYDGVKAGGDYDPGQLVMLAERLRARGCDAVIVGCTELSVIYQGLSQRPDWLYDSLDILADRCVEIYQHARDMGVLPQM